MKCCNIWPNGGSAKRNAKAHDLWQRSIPIAGTIGATYLRSRGITSDPPEALRFTRAAYHFLERTEFPAMVTLLTLLPARRLVAFT